MWGRLLVVPLEASVFAQLGDTRSLGLATLIAVGAIIVGFVVRRIWPARLNPSLFGSLAALGVVAGLAALGVPTAGLVLWAALAVTALLLVLAIVFN